MYSIVLMTALSAGAETPDCGRRHYYSCYCPPVVCYYVVPCVPADGMSQAGQEEGDDFTAEDIEQLKKAGASNDNVNELKKAGFSHATMKEALKSLKDEGIGQKDSPFTTDDLKELEKAGASEQNVKELTEAGYGHERIKEAVELIKNNKDEARGLRIPATIVVRLPADARLTFDDEPTTSSTGRRVFLSPGLPTGQVFHYTLKAERTVDGVKQSATARIAVSGGSKSTVTLEFATADVAQK